MLWPISIASIRQKESWLRVYRVEVESAVYQVHSLLGAQQHAANAV
jgi:hypothetical protein